MGVQVLLAAVIGSWVGWYSWERRVGTSVVRMVRPRPAPVVPRRRPVEQLASDLRRLRAAYGQDGVRFAKWEGTRQAYDAALAEAADTFEIAHLLALLPPGVDRDDERARLERLLEGTGLLPTADAA